MDGLLLKEENILDKTKKYTIVFVVICFIIIGVIGIYRTTTPLPKVKPVAEKTETVETPQKEDTLTTKEDKKETQDKPKKEKQPETTKKEKKQTTNTTTNQTTQQTPQEKPKHEEVKPQKDKVQVSIQGADVFTINQTIEIEKDQSVYDVLKSLATMKKIDINTNGFGPAIYVRGINGLNEFDQGSQSGWKYKVNGTFPSASAGTYKVNNGDKVEWIYIINE